MVSHDLICTSSGRFVPGGGDITSADGRPDHKPRLPTTNGLTRAWRSCPREARGKVHAMTSYWRAVCDVMPTGVVHPKARLGSWVAGSRCLLSVRGMAPQDAARPGQPIAPSCAG